MINENELMEEGKMTGEKNLLNPVLEQRESIKLIKNTKGYNWEIKILNLQMDSPTYNTNKNIMIEAFDIARLEKLNEEMIKRFGAEPI